jgi:hypothetical protein
MNKDDLYKELEQIYLDHPDGREAQAFIAHFSVYCHSIDDIIDEKDTTPSLVVGTCHLALKLFSSEFYRKNQATLYPIINQIYHTYQDSIVFENAEEAWKKNVADIIKSCQQELTLVIVELLGGYDARRKLGPVIREYVYNLQHEKEN